MTQSIMKPNHEWDIFMMEEYLEDTVVTNSNERAQPEKDIRIQEAMNWDKLWRSRYSYLCSTKVRS